MRIDTDKIKNKKFIEPIKSEPQKHSQEYRVLATLRYLYPNRFENMVTDESPDLQDNKNGVGIEVTIAVDFRDMRASREFANLQQNNGNTEKYKKPLFQVVILFSLYLSKKMQLRYLLRVHRMEKSSFFKRVYEEKQESFSCTEEISGRLVLRYFYLKFQPPMQKITYLNGFVKCLTSLRTCLILCM